MKLRRDEFTIPPGAVTWGCWKMYLDGTRGRREAMKGEPLDSGQVPSSWDVSDLSPDRVLEWWGPARYRIDFFDAKGNFMKGHSATIEVAAPPSRAPKLGKRRGRNRDDEADEAPAGRPAMRERMGFGEVWALLQQERREGEAREQRAIERQRAENATQLQLQQQQHQFMMQMVAQLGTARAPIDGMAELLQREMRLSVRELGQQLRGELLADPGEGEDEPDPDPRPPPANAEQAIEGLIGSAIGALEQEVPGMIQKVILPKLGEWLQLNGKSLSPQTNARVEAAARAAAQRRHANGA